MATQRSAALSKQDKKRVEERSKTVLRETGSTSEIPVKVVAISRKLGFFVGQAILEKGTVGVIAVDKAKETIFDTDRNMVIVVDQTLDDARRRYIIAHELGHYILRDTQDAPVFALRETAHERNDKENEADYFAACLLMPKDAYLSELKSVCRTLKLASDYTELREPEKYKAADWLSKRFDVPQLTALRRIDEVSRTE